MLRVDQEFPYERHCRIDKTLPQRGKRRSIGVTVAGTILLSSSILLMNFIALLIKLAFALLSYCDMDYSAEGAFYRDQADREL